MPKTMSFWWCITIISFVVISFFSGYDSLIEKNSYLVRKIKNAKHARFFKYFVVIFLTIVCYAQFFIESFETIIETFNLGVSFCLIIGMFIVFMVIFAMAYIFGEDAKKVEYEKKFNNTKKQHYY